MEKGAPKTALSNVISLASGLFAVAGLGRAGWRRRAARNEARPWLLLGAGVASWTLGRAVWLVLQVFLKANPFPSVADVFFLAACPLVFGGICLLPRPQLRGRERRLMALDGVIVMVAGALVFWNVLVGPHVGPGGGAWTTAVWLSVACPALELTLLWPLASLLLLKDARRDQVATVLLVVGLMVMIVADCVFGTQELRADFETGSIADLLHATAMALAALAGLRASVGRPLPQRGAGAEVSPADWRQHLPHAVLCAETRPARALCQRLLGQGGARTARRPRAGRLFAKALHAPVRGRGALRGHLPRGGEIGRASGVARRREVA